jgi:hypothetical protein
MTVAQAVPNVLKERFNRLAFRTSPMRAAIILILFAFAATSCSPEHETTDPDLCAIKYFNPVPYNPQNLKQCVDACKVCERGTTRTCGTSCALRGAS